jgi:hypothetical protein
MVNGRVARVFSGLLAGVSAIVISGCVNFSALDDLEAAPPPTTPFALALYQDYTYLAHSFGSIGQAGYSSFDQTGSYSLTQANGDVADLANQYAAKALQLTKGEMVDPEPSRDIATHEVRDRLIRALTAGSDVFPRDAARAQADFDCWQLNADIASQAAAATQCRRSLDVSLPRLETEVKSIPPKPAPTEKAPSAAEPVLEQSD